MRPVRPASMAERSEWFDERTGSNSGTARRLQWRALAAAAEASLRPAGGAVLERHQDDLNQQTLVVMPAKAGTHNHRPVFMDTGFCRGDPQQACEADGSRVVDDFAFSASSGISCRGARLQRRKHDSGAVTVAGILRHSVFWPKKTRLLPEALYRFAHPGARGASSMQHPHVATIGPT
jgi:hypothetical protein